jgi:DNA mismatch repair protein MSH4
VQSTLDLTSLKVSTKSETTGSTYRLVELVQTEERFHEVKDALKTLNKLDFDKLISAVCLILLRCFVRPDTAADEQLAASEARATNSAKTASVRVSQMLNLRSIVKNIPLLAKALEGSRSQLLHIIQVVRKHALFFMAIE